jgi:hypothetical protein
MASSYSFQNAFGAILLLHIARMNNYHQHQAQDIYQEMAFTSVHLLGRVKATFAPFSVVFTD